MAATIVYCKTGNYSDCVKIATIAIAKGIAVFEFAIIFYELVDSSRFIRLR